jgi:DNA-binding MarR family transcriptional regulator
LGQEDLTGGMALRAKPRRQPGARARDPLDDNLLDHPGHLIRRVHQISVSAFLEVCAELDLTPTQYAALAGVACRPGIDQAALAGLIAIDRSTAGVVVARLVERGLMRRVQSSTDRRFMSLDLTPAGKAVFEAMSGRAEAAHEIMLGPLSRAERQALVRLMKKLVLFNNQVSRAPLQFPGSGRDGDAPRKIPA